MIGINSGAYESTWRPTPLVLALLAILLWTLGIWFELTLPGAIAASGGLAIAVTTPLFGLAFAKQSVYELDLKLAIVGLQRDMNFGKSVMPNLPATGQSSVMEEISANEVKLQIFSDDIEMQYKFSAGLLLTQSIIVGVSSGIWSVGEWIGNYIFHCGRITC